MTTLTIDIPRDELASMVKHVLDYEIPGRVNPALGPGYIIGNSKYVESTSRKHKILLALEKALAEKPLELYLDVYCPSCRQMYRAPLGFLEQHLHTCEKLPPEEKTPGRNYDRYDGLSNLPDVWAPTW